MEFKDEKKFSHLEKNAPTLQSTATTVMSIT
jgi:hypothetical protein